jgi:DNA-binding response OmpR family regulator
MREGRLSPGVELLSKPFSFAGLASRIRELLDRRQESLGGDRILVVDDEVLIRMLVVDTLAQAGLQAEEAGSFHQALAKFHSVGDKLAAAIIDLGLPDKPGDALVAEIRGLRPGLPIILATGYASENVRHRFGDDALLQIVGKPFDPRALISSLTRFGIRVRGA